MNHHQRVDVPHLVARFSVSVSVVCFVFLCVSVRARALCCAAVSNSNADCRSYVECHLASREVVLSFKGCGLWLLRVSLVRDLQV